MRSYHLLADVVLVLHLAFIVFVIFGGLLVLWRPRIAWAHVPAALWGILIEYAGFICPLTPVENEFRLRAGESAYSGGFIAHYIEPVVYPPGLTRAHQIAMAAVFLVLNAAVYTVVVRRLRKKRAARR